MKKEKQGQALSPPPLAARSIWAVVRTQKLRALLRANEEQAKAWLQWLSAPSRDHFLHRAGSPD